MVSCYQGGLTLSSGHWLSDVLHLVWAKLKCSALLPYWLQADDRDMRAYFLIFLMWFVVIGIIPFLEKIYKKILQYLDALEKRKEASTAGVKIVPPRMPQVPQETLEVYDFEVIVLTRLARAGRKGHTLKHMAGALLLYPSIVEKTLASLGTKGLIGVTRTYVAGNRYHLTRKGRNYLIQHGFIPRPHPRYWQKVA